jgi:hypothetical protein
MPGQNDLSLSAMPRPCASALAGEKAESETERPIGQW